MSSSLSSAKIEASFLVTSLVLLDFIAVSKIDLTMGSLQETLFFVTESLAFLNSSRRFLSLVLRSSDSLLRIASKRFLAMLKLL